MLRPCPNPWCRRGVVCCVHRSAGGRQVRHRACPTCGGAGRVEEEHEDLRAAGVFVWDSSEEDFRSSPTHWRR